MSHDSVCRAIKRSGMCRGRLSDGYHEIIKYASEMTMQSFPDVVNKHEFFISNERIFQAVISSSVHLQRQLGWQRIIRSSTQCPDMNVEIIGGDVLRVELEYDASNFVLHGQKPWVVDLIISFCRRDSVRFVCGVPVWSFYKYGCKADKLLDWTFDTDMRTDFESVASAWDE